MANLSRNGAGAGTNLSKSSAVDGTNKERSQYFYSTFDSDDTFDSNEDFTKKTYPPTGTNPGTNLIRN
jgi:hypothetical protein